MATTDQKMHTTKNQTHHHTTTTNNNKTHKPSFPKKKIGFIATLSAALSRRRYHPPRLIGTLYGRRQGPVHIAFQFDPLTQPAALLQLPTQTNTLVKEMAASGLMRIALECDRRGGEAKQLVEEGMWRVFCNGRRCGFAFRRECRGGDWRVLRAVGRVTVGAGVVPGDGEEGEVMYVRGVFERVVGSKDSEAFYMMDPDGGGGCPELSVYLLRV